VYKRNLHQSSYFLVHFPFRMAWNGFSTSIFRFALKYAISKVYKSGVIGIEWGTSVTRLC